MPRLDTDDLLKAMRKIELNSMRRYVITEGLSPKQLAEYLKCVNIYFSGSLVPPFNHQDLLKLSEFIEFKITELNPELQPFPPSTTDFLQAAIQRLASSSHSAAQASRPGLTKLLSDSALTAAPAAAAVAHTFPPIPLELHAYGFHKDNLPDVQQDINRVCLLVIDEKTMDGHVVSSIRNYMKRHETDEQVQMVICTHAHLETVLSKLEAQDIAVKLRLTDHYTFGSDHYAGFTGAGDDSESTQIIIASQIAQTINQFSNIRKVVLAGCLTARLDSKQKVRKLAYKDAPETEKTFAALVRTTKKPVHLIQSDESHTQGYPKKLVFFSDDIPARKFFSGLLREIAVRIEPREKELALNGMPEIYDDLEDGKVALKARFSSQKSALIKSIKIVIPGTASELKEDIKEKRTDHTKKSP